MAFLFRDPVFDGAADPVLVPNPREGQWWLLYTNRRATAPQGGGVAWVHGTDIGVASSGDHGSSWVYRGVLAGLDHEFGRNTFWAPEVFWAGGICHMYVSYVRGVPDRWVGHERRIHHYTSPDMKTWQHHGPLSLASDYVIDAGVFALPGGGYRMWYKNEADGATTWASDSNDLFSWGDHRRVLSTPGGHEGPNVFSFGGSYWLIVDSWEGQLAFRSDDLDSWAPAGRILSGRDGAEPDAGDGPGLHADVVVVGGATQAGGGAGRASAAEAQAWIVYFTHPAHDGDRETWATRRSSVRIAALTVVDDVLVCNPRAEANLRLPDIIA